MCLLERFELVGYKNNTQIDHSGIAPPFFGFRKLVISSIDDVQRNWFEDCSWFWNEWLCSAEHELYPTISDVGVRSANGTANRGTEDEQARQIARRTSSEERDRSCFT